MKWLAICFLICFCFVCVTIEFQTKKIKWEKPNDAIIKYIISVCVCVFRSFLFLVLLFRMRRTEKNNICIRICNHAITFSLYNV